MNNLPKTIKFDSEKADLIKSGKKNTTWRLFDDKNLTVGDYISCIRKPELSVFARAIITEVKEKTLGNMDPTDYDDHHIFESEKARYCQFSNYYNQKVDGKTKVKIIKFKLEKDKPPNCKSLA